MEQLIRNEIRRFVLESPDNRFPESGQPYFDEPVVGFAAATDPLFGQFKTIIGEFHMTPAEIMGNTFGPGVGKASTVICWILPITRETRESNRREERMPSLSWALTRAHGERFNTLLRMHLVELFRYLGVQAVAPLLSGMWRPVKEAPAGMASTWSERRGLRRRSRHIQPERWADHREGNRPSLRQRHYGRGHPPNAEELCRPIEQLPLFP
jgi:epoxyqueuosine reductase